MHSSGTGYGLYFEAWGIKHSGSVSSKEQAQERELTAGQGWFQMTLWKGKSPSGSIAEGSVGECWTNTPPMEFCGRKTLKTILLAARHEEKWQCVSTKPEKKVYIQK